VIVTLELVIVAADSNFLARLTVICCVTEKNRQSVFLAINCHLLELSAASFFLNISWLSQKAATNLVSRWNF